ncbi:MAG: hypothetical protein KDC61_14300 [Saprospiraceae bacterium]|nr:hypothetical protein [Saprospiraceae bacterium]
MKNTLYAHQQPPASPSGPAQFLKNLFFPYFSGSSVKIGEHLEVDMHAHWLPGVDDGAQSDREGLEMIRGLQDLGYRKLIATPHIKAMYENGPKNLAKAFDRFKRVVIKEGIRIELGMAAEYMLDEEFEKHLKSGPLLTLKENYVLVELSHHNVNILKSLQKTLFNLQVEGYRPVLAHPERYHYYFENFKTIEGLKEAGCLFQLNALSLAGHEGREITKRARKLLDQGWYEFVGSDLHNPQQLAMLKKVSLTHEFQNNHF